MQTRIDLASTGRDSLNIELGESFARAYLQARGEKLEGEEVEGKKEREIKRGHLRAAIVATPAALPALVVSSQTCSPVPPSLRKTTSCRVDRTTSGRTVAFHLIVEARSRQRVFTTRRKYCERIPLTPRQRASFELQQRAGGRNKMQGRSSQWRS